MHKKLFFIILAFIIILLPACKDPEETDDTDLVRDSAVYVFTINDTHGAFYNDGIFPGMENIGGLLNSLSKKSPNYIKIAVGDIFQGSYVSNSFYGLPQVEALNTMGFDAFVLGNHEFDWGLDKIAVYADGNPDNGEANFPFLAANIEYEGSKLPWTKDYVIVERGGYKVGIIGVIGYGLESSILSEHIAGYEFLDPERVVKRLSGKLRSEENCDLVLVAMHGYSESFNYNVSRFSEASYIDGIICAHTHIKIEDYIEREDDYLIPIIQNNDKNRNAGELIFNFSKEGKLLNAGISHYNPALFETDAAVFQIIDSYSETIAVGNEVIGHTTEELYKDRLGREIVAAINEAFQTDVSFINTGGIRATIKRGEITVNDVFQVFPFDNTVIVTEISGSWLKELYWDQKNFLYFNDDFTFMDINNNDIYLIAVVDYVYFGSYYTKYFQEFMPDETEILARDIFIDYVRGYYK